MRELSYREAAEQLKVSPATVKNWRRQGILSATNQLGFLESDIKHLKKKLTQNKNLRLRSRANKSSASNRFIPSEYIEKKISRKTLNRLSENLISINDDISVILFSLSLHLIDKAGLIDNSKEGFPQIKNKNLAAEIDLWYEELKSPPYEELMVIFSSLPIPDQRDTCGLIYQMLQCEGRKSKKGSYYTPPGYADEVLNQYGEKGQKFLDPCCGTGMFLLAAARKYDSPDNIYGWDTDKTAVHIARINLMLYFKDRDFIPHIYLKNSLTENTNEKFDIIATNPPWGHHFDKKEHDLIKNKYKKIKTGESFSYFIAAGIGLLRKGGILSYLLPEALLKVNTHRDIRKLLLENGHIRYIKFLGKPFFRVQTRVIRMDLSADGENKKTTVFKKNKIYSVDSARFFKNTHLLFDFNCNQRDYSIMDRVYSGNYTTLKSKTLWILGIVSGNNNKFISTVEKKDYLPFISGQDLESCRISEPERFIYFNREVLQQSAPGEYYSRSPKIVYKFITDKPVFAIDRAGYITLNSANSFCPEPEIPVETIAALFNSHLYRFIIKKRFNSIKVLRSHLEQLPIPSFNLEQSLFLKETVTRIEQSDCENDMALLKKMNDFIFHYFRISDSDKKYIMENL